MGNAFSNGHQPLAMIAVGRQLRLQRFQVVIFRDALLSMAHESGFVDSKTFSLCLNRARITHQNAIEMFNLLFTMWDNYGNDCIPAKPFAVGVAPLACSCDELALVLRFVLYVSDNTKDGTIRPIDLKHVLNSINQTASYFGDTQLESASIGCIVEAVFDRETSEISHELCARKLCANAYVRRFVSGQARSTVQFKDDVPRVLEVTHERPNQFEMSEIANDCLTADEESLDEDARWLLEIEQGTCAEGHHIKSSFSRQDSVFGSLISNISNQSPLDPPPNVGRGFRSRCRDPPTMKQ